MVHALQEIRRVLTPRGTMIDLRPLAGGWPVEVSSRAGNQRAGSVTDLPVGLADDAAANLAMSDAERSGWYVREHETQFPLMYYWDSPTEAQEWVQEEWSDFISIDDDVWKRVRSLWAVADADARVRVRANMLITRWRRAE